MYDTTHPSLIVISTPGKLYLAETHHFKQAIGDCRDRRGRLPKTRDAHMRIGTAPYIWNDLENGTSERLDNYSIRDLEELYERILAHYKHYGSSSVKTVREVWNEIPKLEQTQPRLPLGTPLASESTEEKPAHARAPSRQGARRNARGPWKKNKTPDEEAGPPNPEEGRP